MKLHLALASALVIGATAAFTPAAFADNTTHTTVTIGGKVDSTLNISATPSTGYNALDLSGGVKTAEVAMLAIDTNNSAGYTLTVKGTGNLEKTGGQTPIPYQVKVADNPNLETFTDATNNNPLQVSTNGANAHGASNKYLYIKYTPANLQDPGDYSAVIDLTVADN